MEYSTETGPTERLRRHEESGFAWSRIEPQIRQRPLAAIGVAALTGFVVGGGLRSRLGSAALLIVARMVVRDMVTQTVANAIRKHDLRDATSNGRY
jgi:hypothetical protein